MLELFKAIKARWVDQNVTGDFYLTSAPQGAAYPYGVLVLVNDTPLYTFTSSREDFLIQLSLYSNEKPAVEVGTMFDEVIAAFDGHSLVVVGYSVCCKFRRLSSRLLRDPEEAWHYVVEYKLVLNDLTSIYA